MLYILKYHATVNCFIVAENREQAEEQVKKILNEDTLHRLCDTGKDFPECSVFTIDIDKD